MRSRVDRRVTSSTASGRWLVLGTLVALGLTQGIFVPHPRPNRAWLTELGASIDKAEPELAANAMSASAMWAANAATVSPAPDTADGKCHLTVANLRTMPHRSHEWAPTLAQLEAAFAAEAFAVHGPVPPAFGDEGAANHMRLTPSHSNPGVEVFVYGVSGGAFPARQSSRPSVVITATRRRLDQSHAAAVKSFCSRRSELIEEQRNGCVLVGAR